MSKRAATARRSGKLCVLAFLVLGGCIQAVATEAPVVDSLAYVGLTRVDPVLVADAIRLRVGEPAHPLLIAQTVQSLYSLGLFEQIKVALDPPTGDHATVILTFTERPRIHQLVFKGNDYFSVEDLKEHAALEVGGLLRSSDLHRACCAIEAAYRDDGWAQAKITPETRAADTSGNIIVCLNIEEGRRVKLRQIHFLGNDSFQADKLRGQVKVKPRGFLRKGRFQREKLEDDVQLLKAFYQNNGFKDAKVILDEPVFSPDGEDVQITFRIQEGPRYRFGKPAWEGASVIADEILRDAMLFWRGDPYDQSKVDQTLAGIYNMYTERGYLVELRIDPVTTVTADTVQVTFNIFEGRPSRVGNIKLVGNTRTKERVIRREIRLFPGDLLRRSLLLRSQRDIFATGYFSDVSVEFEPSEVEGEVDVSFRVEEHSSATANGGVGYSSQMGLTGFVKFGHNNLFGNGQSLALELEKGKRREFYDLSFTEPWLCGRPISFGIDIYRTQNHRDVYAGESYNASYWHSVRGGGLRVGFPWIFSVPDYTRMSLGYSYSDTRYEDYSNLPERTQELLVQGDGTRSRVFVSLYRNSTDNPFHPTLGTRSTWRNEFNGGPLGGDMDYYRLTLDHRHYFVALWKP
ncbi:MAG: outer membrane protein assembly factor BamA, partial [Candidatus Eisenbacteria sp.]|nr:outer membrane protein assembly factor BamA [Candidatus Eisenbacteria bacterium]